MAYCTPFWWFPLIFSMKGRLKMGFNVYSESVWFLLRIWRVINSRLYISWFEMVKIFYYILKFLTSLFFVSFNNPFILSFVVSGKFFSGFLIFIINEFNIVLSREEIMNIHSTVVSSKISLNNSCLIVKILQIFLSISSFLYINKAFSC